jgi:hypothetical protein
MNAFQHSTDDILYSTSNTMHTFQHHSVNNTLNTSQHSTANTLNTSMHRDQNMMYSTNNTMNAFQHSVNNAMNTSQHSTANTLNTSMHINQNAANSFMADFSESLKAALKKVAKEDKKALKKKAEKKDRKDKEKAEKKDKKKRDKESKEKLPKLQEGDSMTSLNFSHNGSSCSLDAGSDSWCLDYTKYKSENVDSDIAIRTYAQQAEKLRIMKVEEEHACKREERRRKREEAKGKSMSDLSVQDKRTVEDIEDALFEDRVTRAFLWYSRLASPNRKDFKRQIATQKWIDITSEDVDLLTWNETGSRVVDYGSGPCSFS